jgi:hypothetical protein
MEQVSGAVSNGSPVPERAEARGWLEQVHELIITGTGILSWVRTKTRRWLGLG